MHTMQWCLRNLHLAGILEWAILKRVSFAQIKLIVWPWADCGTGLLPKDMNQCPPLGHRVRRKYYIYYSVIHNKASGGTTSLQVYGLLRRQCPGQYSGTLLRPVRFITLCRIKNNIINSPIHNGLLEAPMLYSKRTGWFATWNMRSSLPTNLAVRFHTNYDTRLRWKVVVGVFSATTAIAGGVESMFWPVRKSPVRQTTALEAGERSCLYLMWVHFKVVKFSNQPLLQWYRGANVLVS